MNNHTETSNCNSINNLLERTLCILEDGFIILDKNRTISYINNAAQEIMKKHSGVNPVPGDDFVSIVQAGRQEMVEAVINQALSGQSIIYRLNYVYHGIQYWCELNYFPIPGEHDMVTHIGIKTRDITEYVILEHRLESQRKARRNAIVKATLDAQEKQRSEIGRELHDNVNQVLTTVKLYNEICLSEQVVDKAMLLRSVQQINYCIETIRKLSQTLATPGDDTIGLKEIVKELAESINATRKASVNFYSYGIRNELISPGLQTTIYRIAQEQLTNVLKYADASLVNVILVGTSGSVALSIQDNGVGFNLKEKRKGVGITNMISRTEAWGGDIEFKTAPGEGCVMMVEFPLTSTTGRMEVSPDGLGFN